MDIPLTVFLIIYFIAAGLFLIYALLSLLHIFRFAHFDAAGYFATGIFIAGLVLILFVSASFISQIDWSTTFTLFNSSNGFNTFPTNTL